MLSAVNRAALLRLHGTLPRFEDGGTVDDDERDDDDEDRDAEEESRDADKEPVEAARPEHEQRVGGQPVGVQLNQPGVVMSPLQLLQLTGVIKGGAPQGPPPVAGSAGAPANGPQGQPTNAPQNASGRPEVQVREPVMDQEPGTTTMAAPPPPQPSTPQDRATHYEKVLADTFGPSPTPEQQAYMDLIRKDPAMQLQWDAQVDQNDMDVQKAYATAGSVEDYVKSAQGFARNTEANLAADHKAREQYFEDYGKAVDAQIAAVPDPNKIPGMEPGTWSRAVSLALAANAAGMGAPSLATMVDQQLKLGMASQDADYERARLRVAKVSGLERIREAGSGAELQGFNVQLGAAQQMMGAQMLKIANDPRYAATQAGINLQNAGALLIQQSRQAQYLAAKNKLDAEKTKSIIAKNLAQAHKLAGGGGGGGTGGTYGTLYGSLNDIDPKRVKLAFPVRQDDGSTAYALADNEKDQADGKATYDSYTGLNSKLDELQRISIDRNGAKSAGGTIWKKWQDNNEQQYQRVLFEFANEWGRIIHGRPLTKGTLDEAFEVIPSLKAVYEGGNTTDLLSGMRDDLDGWYQDKLPGLGVKKEVRSQRPQRSGEPDSVQIGKQIIGDFVPGMVPDVGNAVGGQANSKQLGALDQYIQHYYDTRTNPDDRQLAEELLGFKAKAHQNLVQATVALSRAKGDAARNTAFTQRNAYRAIEEAIGRKAVEVFSGAARPGKVAHRSTEDEPVDMPYGDMP